MASKHIEITGTASRLSSDLRGLVDSTRNVQNKANTVKAILDQVLNVDDWQAVADKLGVSLADAPIVYDLLITYHTKITGVTGINNFIDRLG